MKARLERLRGELSNGGLGAILISQPENRCYLSGFTGSAGYLLISPQRAILATDFRYIEQAKGEAPDFEIVQTKGDLEGWLFKLTSELGIRRLGFEAGHLPFAIYRQLNDGLSHIPDEPDLIPTDNLVEPLRALKESEELELISKAVELADAAFEYIRSIIRPGLKEREVAWELERFLRERGSEPLPFDLLVASGPNSALPHAKPTDRTIEAGEPVIIDLGASVGGYSSDLSRTLCLEGSDENFAIIYDLVSTAQLAAITEMEVGMSGGEADLLARAIIEQVGYGDAFGHGLGHGIGLAAHELPRLAPNSSTILADNMVFTVEPGIYIPGWGGVRIEDIVVMEGGKARRLSQAER